MNESRGRNIFVFIVEDFGRYAAFRGNDVGAVS